MLVGAAAGGECAALLNIVGAIWLWFRSGVARKDLALLWGGWSWETLDEVLRKIKFPFGLLMNARPPCILEVARWKGTGVMEPTSRHLYNPTSVAENVG